MTRLVWAYDGRDPQAVYHLIARNGRHVSVCGVDMPFVPTRYAEQRPHDEERICPTCVAAAEAEHETYP